MMNKEVDCNTASEKVDLELPQEIWVQVFSHVLSPVDFIALCCTCKSLYLEKERFCYCLFSCVLKDPALFTLFLEKAKKKGVDEKIPEIDLLTWYLKERTL
jgi:hypothetical protein